MSTSIRLFYTPPQADDPFPIRPQQARFAGGIQVKDPHEAEARLYAYTHRLFQDHEKLLGDLHRNRPFYRALEKHVTAASSVLDIGSGTGIWAIAAAVMGARRVVAVEQDPLLTGIIQSLARDNGVADRVEVVAADSRQVHLEKDFDIVVTETIGNLAFDEQIVSITMDARRRFLKPGGVLIPETLALLAAPAHFEPPHQSLPAGLSIDYRYFESLALNVPVGLTGADRLKLLGEPQALIDVDLTRIEAQPDLSDLTARWALADASPVNGFAVWAESMVTRGVRLTTRRTTSWSPVIYRIRPFQAPQGDLAFTLTLTSASNYWTAILSTGQDRETRSYSPAHAATALLAHTRTDTDLPDHARAAKARD